MPPKITPQEFKALDDSMVEIVDFLWAHENHIVDEATTHRKLFSIKCLHDALDKHRAHLNELLDIDLVVDPSKQTEKYPFGENGNK